MQHRTKNLLFFSLKLAISVAILLYVYSKIEVENISTAIAKVDWFLLFIAGFLIFTSFLINAVRVKTYFDNAGCHFSYGFIAKKFLAGSFLGLALPGTLGCDSYVSYHVNKNYKFSFVKSLSLVLNSRLNGLYFIGIIICLLAYFSSYNGQMPFLIEGIVFLIAAQSLVYFLLAKYIFKEQLTVFLKAAWISILIQVIMCLSAVIIFHALGHKIHWVDICTIFLLTNLIHMLPISIGGLGFREYVFFQAFTLQNMNPEIGVAFSAIYFVLFALSSLPGLYFIVKNKR